MTKAKSANGEIMLGRVQRGNLDESHTEMSANPGTHEAFAVGRFVMLSDASPQRTPHSAPIVAATTIRRANRRTVHPVLCRWRRASAVALAPLPRGQPARRLG